MLKQNTLHQSAVAVSSETLGKPWKQFELNHQFQPTIPAPIIVLLTNSDTRLPIMPVSPTPKSNLDCNWKVSPGTEVLGMSIRCNTVAGPVLVDRRSPSRLKTLRQYSSPSLLSFQVFQRYQVNTDLLDNHLTIAIVQVKIVERRHCFTGL
jgi:hypothetical protein